MTGPIERKAQELARGAHSNREISHRIADFVRNRIRYSLDEWNVPAHEVLTKRKGMCSGKALLAAALHRVCSIPARFKIIRIEAGDDLFTFIAKRLSEADSLTPVLKEREEVLRSMASLPPERDHMIIQVLLDDIWYDLDVARDEELDYGMKVLGIWKDRRVLSEDGPFHSVERWLQERMGRRTVLRSRETFFQLINQQIEKVRLAGSLAMKGGIEVWGDSEIRESLKSWMIIPDYPLKFETSSFPAIDELIWCTKDDLVSISDLEEKSLAEERLLAWLYALVRTNIKRGRFWNLPDVLRHRRADCLGYAQLFSRIAGSCGLDTGVIEIIQDNRRKYVPHVAGLVTFANGMRKLVDLWYGALGIRHRLVTARVRRGDRTSTTILTLTQLESFPNADGFSSEEIWGIGFYILGNSFLQRGMEEDAVCSYDVSLWLYPSNTRAVFNRAITFERMGEQERSQQDYERAFSMKGGLLRLLASVEDIEGLVRLDEKGLDAVEEQIYLLRMGFTTGKKESWRNIAEKLDASLPEMKRKWNRIEMELARGEEK